MSSALHNLAFFQSIRPKIQVGLYKMNDPGLDDAIADEANALDQYSSQAKPEDTSSAGCTDKKQRQLDSASPVAARWWLASTVYPLAAVCTIHIGRSKLQILISMQGTFGPMASAFNVCCLAQTWRMMPDDRDGYLNIADPKW
jgi:potassium channel subfamily K